MAAGRSTVYAGAASAAQHLGTMCIRKLCYFCSTCDSFSQASSCDRSYYRVFSVSCLFHQGHVSGWAQPAQHSAADGCLRNVGLGYVDHGCLP